MAVTNGWGQGVINNTNGWGKLATNNIGAGSVYENSASGDTALIGTSAAFSYSASSFTQADADPTPTITGTTGGTFSGTTGLVFVSTSTGQIDLSASTIAAHVVTYTVGGVSSNFNLSVTAAPFSNTLSYNFDGVDDFIEANLDGTASGGILAASDSDINLSVSFWFASQGNNNNKGIISWGNHIPDGFPAFFTVQQIFQSGQRKIQVQADGASYRGTVDISNTDGVWHHVLITRTSSDNSWRGFLNGSSSAWFTHDDGGSITYRNFAEKLYIGAGYVPYYSGNIDEVSVFNSVQNAATIYGTGVPNDISSLNPLAWYRMGENSNYKSPQWLMKENSNKDKFSNYSFEFDGVDDFIQLSSGVSFSGEFTLSVWIKPNGFSNNQVILGNGTSSNNWIRLTSASTITFKVASTSLSFADVGNNLVDGVWQHLLIYRDSSNNIGIFRNGSAFSSSQNNSNTLELSTFGKRGNIEYTGSLDEIAFWTSDQSSNVSSIYNSGEPTTITGATNYYRLGEQANFTDNWLVNNSALDNYSTKSFSFDGVDDYMTVSTPTTLTDFTTSVWIHRTGNGNFDGIFGQDSSTAKGGILRYVSLDGTGIVLYLTSGWTAMSGALAIDTWHHFALTYDSTANELKSYINGSLYTTISSPDFSGQSTDAHSFSRIGMRNGNTSTSFPGLLDEIALWNTAKSSTDITAIYNSGEPTTITGAIAHWRMGENATFSTNWSIPDQVGSSTVASVNMDLADLEGNAPNYTGGGLSANMTIEDRVGEAPNSSNNSLSYNMVEADRETDVPS